MQLEGKELRGFGTELEIDDFTGAFSGYLAFADGSFVQVEFAETETDFGPDGTSFEPELELITLDDDPSGSFWELAGVVERAEPVAEKITAYDNGEAVWEWVRNAGLVVHLDTGDVLSFHCSSPRAPEVVMRVNQPLPPVDTKVYQQHQTRTYSYERL